MSIATHMVAMRDGVRLATDVHLPDGAGPFPVIMERTPYGRHETSRAELTAADRTPATRAEIAAYFTAHGYAVVYQDTRGRYGSEGRFVKYLSDGEDGFDACAWLRDRSWCDGRICTMGLSYAAHTQAALGCLDPPGLVAQVLDCGGFANSWKSGIRQSGAFELKQATWAFKNALVSPEAQADPVLQRGAGGGGHPRLVHPHAVEARPLAAAPPSRLRGLPVRPMDARRGRRRSGSSSASGPRVRTTRYSRAACVHMSSWWDPYPLTATSNYTGLKRAGRGPQRLILGPWTHGDRSNHCFGDVEFGPAAPLDSWAGDWRAYRLRCFDHVVKGAALDEPAVRVFVMGGGNGRRDEAGHLDHGGRWITADDWPPPGVEFTPFHLHGDGRLDRAAPAAGAAALSLRFRPGASGADDRRGHEQSRSGGLCGELESGGGAGVLRLHAALPAAGVAAGRAGVPDRAAVRASAGGWASGGGLVGRHRRARYRLHRQADRCASAVRRLSGRLRDDPDRRHPAPALRRGSVPAAACASPAKWCESVSPCSPPPTCSCPATASGWTYRRAIFRNSTSTRTPASRRAWRGGGVSR